MTHLINFTLSGVTGLYVAQVVPASADAITNAIDKGGAGILSGVIIWWLLNRFSKQLDAQNTIIGELRDSLRNLSDALQKKPCLKSKDEDFTG